MLFRFGRFGFGLSSLRPMNGLTHSPGYHLAHVVDDIRIQSETAQEHLNTVVAVLNRCR